MIQGSASEAVLTAMVAARDKYLLETVPDHLSEEEREDVIAHKRSRMVALATTATHSSTKKAAIILGVRFKTIKVREEDNYALTAPVLAAALEECRAKGLEPFFLTATLGTTDTCAVDDFAGITSALSQSPTPPGSKGEIWVHVDAAYAGAALVCPEVQEATQIPLIKNFHSFDMNMHKWLLTNFDASCLFVRNRNWFIQALSINQAVYGNAASDGGLVTDYREWQIPLGRRFRSLKIWFVLRSYGAEGLRGYIRRTTRLGEEFTEWLGQRKDLFEVLTGPSFALTVFRVSSPKLRGARQGNGHVERVTNGTANGVVNGVGKEDEDERQQNELTKRLCDKVNCSGKMWVTSTVLDGRFAIRFMTGVRTTEREHVEAAFRMLVDTAEKVVKGE